MNIKRGLIRVWVVLSVLFIVATAMLAYDGIAREFRYDHVLDGIPSNGVVLVPVKCKDARGTLGTDYELAKDVNIKRPEGTCSYRLPDFRRLYTEYDDLSDGQLVYKLNLAEGVKMDIRSPWWSVASTAVFAIGWPLALLAIGSAIYWALAGFARPTSDP
jgi:hypothetical protein